MALPSEIRFAKIAVSSAASNSVVSAPGAGQAIRVCGLALVCAGAVTVTVEDGDGTDITGPMSFAANGGIVWPTTQDGYGQAVAGKSLCILLGGAVAVSGTLAYRVVTA